MKKKIVITALTLSIVAVGTAWAFGGPHRGCGPMEAMGAMGPMGAPAFAKERVMERLRALPPEQRAQARELLEQGRGEGLELRQQLVNARFELMKLGLAEEWNQQAAERETTKLADALAALALHQTKLRHRLRTLNDTAK